MTFVLSKLLFFVLAPLNVAILLLTAAMLAIYKRRNRLAQRLGIAGWAVLFVFGVLPTGPYLMARLEGVYPANDLPRKVEGVILLGGFIDTEVGLNHATPQLGDSTDRLIKFTDMAQQYPYARLVFTSGQGTLSQNGVPEGQLIKPLLERMRAYTRWRLTIEDQSKTTWENARNSYELVKPKGQWVLVTSAWHMPRAMGAFRAAGWDVVAAPSDYRADGLRAGFLDNLALSHTAIKEIGGIIVYKLLGRWTTEVPHAK